ncbi:EspA/EspE family type VII secretion system effector, partial [Mycobacterium sp. 050134]
WLPGPYEGDCLEKRSQCFTQVASLLSQARVPGWSGTAAGAYSDILGQMIGVARGLGKNDTGMARDVAAQAEVIGDAQIAISAGQGFLAAALPIVLVMESRPETVIAAATLALVATSMAVAEALFYLIRSLVSAYRVAGLAHDHDYRVPKWSIPSVIAMHSASPAGVQAGPMGMGSDGVAGYSGSVVDGGVTAIASIPGPASAGLAAVEGSGVGVGGTGVVSPASGPRPSVQSANRAVAGVSLWERSVVRGPGVVSVRDGSAISGHVAGAAGVSSGKRAPLNAGLAAGAVGDADACAEDLVRA